ncbi:YwiC-like protein [Sanguibacter antarcticus]|uniref:YwiC-like protein n=1 Tax=Sanguibacter antarcticus TaxID=372484 RepID=A0A2A9E7W5_9MICO|nr:YwiC-like protein [Sanguibacter antarcticus]
MPAHPPRPPRSRRRRRRRSPGWVPDQHGAWAMLAVPFVVGTLAGGPAPVHVLLAVLWVVGYLDFYAVGLWLRSRRKARYLPPVRAWSIALVVPAAAVLVLCPALVLWAPVFLPLVVTSLWCSHARRDRSLLNDGVTILAACLMLPVAFSAGLPHASLHDVGGWLGAATAPGWSQVGAATGMVLAYFFGTALYVKTLVRRRGDLWFRAVSVDYHAVVTVVVAWAAWAAGRPWWPVAAVFVLLTARSWWVPRTAAKPLQFGLGELAASVVVGILALGVVGVLG